MKKNSFFFVMAIIAFTISGFAQSRCFICIDNSSSMKNRNFYERMINAVVDKYKTGEIHIIPFGDRNLPKDFVSYTQFSNFIRDTTFSTTDFVQLCEFIENIVSTENNSQENSNGESNTDQFIIITDGEHDLSSTAPFHDLSYAEIGDMLNVINRLQNYRKNIKILHILDSPGPVNGTKADINRLQNYRGRLAGITDSAIIKGLTHDFLMNLTTADNYYHCKNRRAAVNVFFKEIFDISGNIPCDEAAFLRDIPIQLKFSWVTAYDQSQFKRFINGRTFCIDGIERTLKITNESNTFVVEIKHYVSNSYIITINGQSIWGDTESKEIESKKIASGEEFNSTAGDISNYISKMIEKNSDPQFKEPRCKYSLKFDGDLLFPFLTNDDFKILQTTCGGGMAPMALVNLSFAPKDRRIYFEIPMISARELHISLPHDKNQIKIIPLGNNVIRDYWDAQEYTISDRNFQIPTINCDFSSVLTANRGTLIFYSAINQRYAGMINRPGYARLYQGQAYRFYYVPDDLRSNGIKSMTLMKINNQEDIRIACDSLNNQRVEPFTTYEDCLTAFQNAANNEEKKRITRRIADSNGFLSLLTNLREIKEDDDKKTTMINIIDTLESIYSGTDEKPFRIIELITSDIPNISNTLRKKYLQIGNIDDNKIFTIINFLSIPFHNLRQLKFYLENRNRDTITQQNIHYFEILERN